MNTVSFSTWRKILPLLGIQLINLILVSITFYFIFDWRNLFPALIWSVVLSSIIYVASVNSTGKEGHAFIQTDALPATLNWRHAQSLAKHLGQHPRFTRWTVEVLEETVQLKRSKMFGLHRWRAEVKIIESGLEIRCTSQSPMGANDSYSTGLYTLDIRDALTKA